MIVCGGGSCSRRTARLPFCMAKVMAGLRASVSPKAGSSVISQGLRARRRKNFRHANVDGVDVESRSMRGPRDGAVTDSGMNAIGNRADLLGRATCHHRHNPGMIRELVIERCRDEEVTGALSSIRRKTRTRAAGHGHHQYAHQQRYGFDGQVGAGR